MSCGVGHRHGLDPVWLWLWPAAVAPMGPLAWEPPYAMGVALKSKKNKNKKAVLLTILMLLVFRDWAADGLPFRIFLLTLLEVYDFFLQLCPVCWSASWKNSLSLTSYFLFSAFPLNLFYIYILPISLLKFLMNSCSFSHIFHRSFNILIIVNESYNVWAGSWSGSVDFFISS